MTSTIISAKSTQEHNPSLHLPTSSTVARQVVQMLETFGVKYAFGVSGGPMAKLWEVLSLSQQIQVHHFRHEGGAAFAAVEASLATNEPVVVFTTTGPGITNALTGLLAGRDEGAKVILLSACTSASQQGKWAIQETSIHTLPSADLFTAGSIFHYATTLNCVEQLPQIARKMGLGLARSHGFMAHLTIPTALQAQEMSDSFSQRHQLPNGMIPSQDTLDQCYELLSQGNFAIWLGFGARNAAPEIRQLAEKTGAAVMCSPRGKGIFPETHPQFVGVTGVGGHSSVFTYMQEQKPKRILVLGTRLGEHTSFWREEMIPTQGFIHVDIDPNVPGVAYPSVPTFPVHADIKNFLQGLLPYFGKKPMMNSETLPQPEPEPLLEPRLEGQVRPQLLMQEIQRVIVNQSDALIMAEVGNSFTWSGHLLRFDDPYRYRVSIRVGSMGHAVTGVVGAAQARQGKAIAIAGDGAMLMNNEISTAVKYQIPAVWIVLNDSCYNICAQGMAMLGLKGADPFLPETDFAAIATAMGAKGIRVEQESAVAQALEQAMNSPEPIVLDIVIDPSQQAPSHGRNKGLMAQKAQKKAEHGISFPVIE